MCSCLFDVADPYGLNRWPAYVCGIELSASGSKDRLLFYPCDWVHNVREEEHVLLLLNEDL